MSQVYVVGHASGQPSPGGFGIIIRQGGRVLLEREQALDITTTLSATLTGVREALTELPPGCIYTEIHINHITAYNLLMELIQPDRHRVKDILNEITILAGQRRIETEYIHLWPGTHRDLDTAETMAHSSARRAWTTIGSPACPHCGDQMTSRRLTDGSFWVCQTPHCGGRLRQYERSI